MTDTTTGNAPNATGPSPEVIEAFTARGKAVGLSDEQIQKTLDAHRVGTAQTAEAQPKSGVGHHSAITPLSKLAPLTTRETEQAIASLRAHWTGPIEQLEAAIAKAEGKAVSGEAEKERLSNFEKAYDAKLAPPESSREYRLDAAYGQRLEGIPTEQAAALDATLKSALHDMGTPAIAAPGIVSALLDGQEVFAAASVGADGQPDPMRIAWFHQNEKAALIAHSKPFGGPDEAMHYALIALENVNADTVAMLHESGALHDHRAVIALAHQGQRLFEREKARLVRRGEL
ncbi:MAG: hypothetical protein ACREEI_02860 [Stellaceae bacterium]